MSEVIVAIVGILALIGGLMVGWFLANRSLSDLRAERDDAEKKLEDAEVRFRDCIRDLAAARERADRADMLEERVESLRLEREATQAELAALRADASNHEKQMKLLIEAKEALSAQFSEVGGKLLGEAQKAFLDRAGERFSQSEEKSAERLNSLLKPVGERLNAYEEAVRKIENERREAYGDLKGLMDQMRSGQQQVRDETARLVNSLRNAPKARGRWGEQQLKNVLEMCGLAEHTDFALEHSVSTEEGRLRPDAIVNVPGDTILVIDAKVSLNAYQDAFDADGDDARKVALSQHCQSMKTHIEGLSRKAYWDQFAKAPDYVIMFVPGEHFLAAALEHDPDIWNFAFEKRVLLATPTNLVAIARTVAGVWRQHKMAAEAQKIGQLGKEMYDRLAVAGEHLKRMGSGLSSAVGNYNKFVGSFERNVMATGRRFAELNIETGRKQLDEVSEIDALPRYADEPNEIAGQETKERDGGLMLSDDRETPNSDQKVLS